MTIDPKRIERLLAACPELRPEGLVEIFECETGFKRGGPKAWFPRVVFVDPAGCNISTCLGWDMLHALIRDKIVWYLNQTVDGRNRIMLSLNDAQLGYDPTEACILAAERVLGLPEWKD